MDWTQIILSVLSLVGTIVVAIISARAADKAKEAAEESKVSVNETKMVSAQVTKLQKANIDMVRNEITKTYYKRKDCKKLYQYERESLDRLYEGYVEAGGNSFVHDIYEEMRHWEILGAGEKIENSVIE